MSECTVYLAEDEPLALEALKMMVLAQPGWRVLGTSTNGASALEECLVLRPDVLVTDIRMPMLTGLELVDCLQQENVSPQVIFATAFDQHAIQAFRLAAVDYLLKPVTVVDVANALQRVRLRCEALRALQEKSLPAKRLGKLVRSMGFTERIVVRSVGRIEFVPVSALIALRAEGNYVALITADKTYLHRQPLKSLLAELDPQRFCQVHRRYVVASEQVRAQLKDGRDFRLVLSNGVEIPATESFLALLGRSS